MFSHSHFLLDSLPFLLQVVVRGIGGWCRPRSCIRIISLLCTIVSMLQLYHHFRCRTCCQEYMGGCDNLPDYVCCLELIILWHCVHCDPPVALVNCDTTLKFTKMSLLCSVMLLVDCFGPRPIASGVQMGGLQLLQMWLTRNLQNTKHRHADHKWALWRQHHKASIWKKHSCDWKHKQQTVDAK